MKKVLTSILFLVFLSIFLYSGYRLYLIYSEYHKGSQTYEETASHYVTVAEPEEAPASSEDPVVLSDACPVQVDFKALQAENPDIIGWLYMADSVINYPVLRGETNDTYLRHLPNGEYNMAGSLFVDYRCPADMTEPTTIIYGHNMHDGSMFAVLESYKDQAFYDSHPFMWYLTPQGVYRLNILSGYIENANHPVYDLYQNPEDVQAFVDYAVPKSSFVSRFSADQADQIFVLSTCDYAYEDARFILVAQPVLEEEENKGAEESAKENQQNNQ